MPSFAQGRARRRDLARLRQPLEAREHRAEVFVVINEIRFARSHLRDWMRTEARDSGSRFSGAAEVLPQPLGSWGHLAWNYPVQLALAPLVGRSPRAIA